MSFFILFLSSLVKRDHHYQVTLLFREITLAECEATLKRYRFTYGYIGPLQDPSEFTCFSCIQFTQSQSFNSYFLSTFCKQLYNSDLNFKSSVLKYSQYFSTAHF